MGEFNYIFQPRGFGVDDKTKKLELEYEKPEVKDYGDLRELTTAAPTGSHTDVPKGTPVPPFSIFS